MSEVRYTEYRKKQPGDRYVWGVLRLKGRKQNFRTVGEGEGARRKAKQVARKLNELEQAPAEASDRFLSWHEAGEPLPLDRTVRDFARSKAHTVAVSTAARYRQFAERLATRMGSMDLRGLQEEDVGRFVREECADDRGKDPTINACVLLRGSILAALRAVDSVGRPHLARDPLPKLLQERLEHPVRRIAVELDVYLRPEVVGEIVERPSRPDRHQNRRRLLVHGELGDCDRVLEEFERTPEIEWAHKDGPSARTPLQQTADHRYKNREPQPGS